MVNIKKNKNSRNCLNQIINWSTSHPSIEICGFLGFDKEKNEYITQLENNCSLDPQNYFAIDALSYLFFKERYSILAIFHSHIVGDEQPSEFDTIMSENCCVPFMIYSLNTKKFKIYEPKNIEYNVKILERIKAKI